MGYSAKYHAMSILAVFLALAVGILIGAGFGDSLVEGGAEQLSESLSRDLTDANAKLEDTETELEAERNYSATTFPALVEGRLAGRRLTVVALGGRPGEIRDDITAALEPSGATVGEVVVLRDPPDRAALAEIVGEDPTAVVADDETFADLTRRIGRSLVGGGQLYNDSRDQLLTGFSGSPGLSDGVIVVRESRPGAEDPEFAETELFESSLIRGLSESTVPIVGAHRTDGEPTTMDFFIDQGIATVDNVNEIPGRVSLVFALRGLEGNFGVGENAGSLLPELLGLSMLTPSDSETDSSDDGENEQAGDETGSQ